MQKTFTIRYVLFSLTMSLIVFSCSDKKQKHETRELEQPEVETQASEGAVRGVWLTNVASKALYSRENIVKAVELCDSLNMNTIFVVTWNRATTTYPSQVVKNLTGVEIQPEFEGRDPLQEVIDEAHKRNIKVFAWFEFGFSSSYKENGGIILEKKPEWSAIDVEGNLVKKNGFEWMNAFHPEVQDFITSLVLEVVDNYDVDGIQGDDRLPAVPSQSGYDEYTVNLYKEQHNGNEPPKYYKDFEWVQWRASLLNEYMKNLYQKVKQHDSTCIVSMAPSIYPWSKEEYLQDWPVWVNQGYCDLIIPQLYRYKIEDYTFLLKNILDNQIVESKRHLFYPGILLQVDDYNPSPEFLTKMIKANREFGINGEVYFFYEGIKKMPQVFLKQYEEKIAFPEL